MGTFCEDMHTGGGIVGYSIGGAVGIAGGALAGKNFTTKALQKAGALGKSTRFVDVHTLYNSMTPNHILTTKPLTNILAGAMILGISLAGVFIGTKAGAAVDADINKKREETVVYA